MRANLFTMRAVAKYIPEFHTIVTSKTMPSSSRRPLCNRFVIRNMRLEKFINHVVINKAFNRFPCGIAARP